MSGTGAYRTDLASIHDAGYCDLARDAALRLVEELRGVGLRDGTVVDLGCGSGILARLVTDAGYSVIGIDVSEAMIALARRRVPEAEFRVDSFVGATIPACVAVTGIGEVLNYVFDDRNDEPARHELFHRAYEGLRPGGLMMFDMAGPDRAAPGEPVRMFAEGADWAVLVQAELDAPARRLTRRITSFRRTGALYRRDTEIHALVLDDPGDVLASLRSTGFVARTLPAYGGTPLPPGVAGFLARKPGHGTLQRHPAAAAPSRPTGEARISPNRKRMRCE